MKVALRFVLIGVTTLLLYGCAGAGDYDISLPGEYSVIRSSGHDITIRKQEAEGYWGEELIPAKIVELNYNDKYILAKQLGLKRQYPNDPDRTYKIPDESKVSLWILQVDNGKVYGPLTEKEFVKKKIELNIPINMTLKNIDSFNRN